MDASSIPARTRTQYLQSIFPGGVPRLWCPPLTHYDQQGVIDSPRIAAHLQHLSPYIGGVLVPGSTGDGWELSRAERREVLAICLKQAAQLNLQLLIGALDPDTSESISLIQEDLAWLKARTGTQSSREALLTARVCGFTVCPPRGNALTQEAICRALNSVLGLTVPLAIYQLPQVTFNEISPEVAADLASRHENFVFFKDTSGTDSIVLSGQHLGGVFTARGAEGDYARWLKLADGPYDGFLLASANCFARELHKVIQDISAGEQEAARTLSKRVTTAIGEILQLASRLPSGNAFANANKALDHFFAYGPKAESLPGPRLHAGINLPREFIRTTGQILTAQKFMPVRGYLD